jgi:hypothetical protein
MGARHFQNPRFDVLPDREGVNPNGVIFKGGDVQSGAMVLFHQRFELRWEFEPPLVIDSGGLAASKHLIAPLCSELLHREGIVEVPSGSVNAKSVQELNLRFIFACEQMAKTGRPLAGA